MKKRSLVFGSIVCIFTCISCNNKPAQQTGQQATVAENDAYQPKEYVELKHPEWSKNATIYEVNVRQFTPRRNF